MKQLGGTAIYLSQAEVGLGQREPVEDVARVLSRYVAGIVARTYAQQALVDLADARRRAGGQRALGRRAPLPGAGRPADHPREERPPQRRTHRLHRRWQQRRCLAGAVGRAVPAPSSSSPRRSGYALPPEIVDTARTWARRTGGAIELVSRRRRPPGTPTSSTRTSGPRWARSRSAAPRMEAFQGYQVDDALMALAKPDAIFMHDLPAHRGEEIDECRDRRRRSPWSSTRPRTACTPRKRCWLQ